MSLRFGTDGIRGTANTELTPELALALGRAAARYLPGGRFFVGSDTRRSGPMLKAALSAGLAAEGRQVSDLGILPTPGLAWIVREHQVPGAMVSASHNPYWDNGIKLISESGTKLSDSLERSIEDELAKLLESLSLARRDIVGELVGEIDNAHSLVDQYIDQLVRSAEIPSGFDLAIVCDCGNGAAFEIAPEVFSRLGISATIIGNSPDGTNINAGYGATDPARLAAEVVGRGADLGLSFDGDADRMIAVDHRGEVVDGDALLVLFALDLRDRGELENDAIVATVMSNLGVRRALDVAGIGLIETPVGDRFVADALDEQGLVLGGEQSGHIVFRRQSTTGDGILTGLKLIELIARRGQSLAELADKAITRVPQELRTVAVTAPDRLGEAPGVWSEVAAVERELGDSGRVVIRPSGTEAAVRVMVEADSRAAVDDALVRIVTAVERELGAATTI
ncbi:MAG TPA: phosphoglucosamine mutase [Acidimicrobiales bacterium]|nr:phosphoglucosamine mutase [Acidimicrobiales bacterium]